MTCLALISPVHQTWPIFSENHILFNTWPLLLEFGVLCSHLGCFVISTFGLPLFALLTCLFCPSNLHLGPVYADWSAYKELVDSMFNSDPCAWIEIIVWIWFPKLVLACIYLWFTLLSLFGTLLFLPVHTYLVSVLHHLLRALNCSTHKLLLSL